MRWFREYLPCFVAPLSILLPNFSACYAFRAQGLERLRVMESSFIGARSFGRPHRVPPTTDMKPKEKHRGAEQVDNSPLFPFDRLVGVAPAINYVSSCLGR